MVSSVQPGQAVQVHAIARVTTCLRAKFKDVHQCEDRDLHGPRRRATMRRPYQSRHIVVPLRTCEPSNVSCSRALQEKLCP
jgi:hypothetical protein